MEPDAEETARYAEFGRALKAAMKGPPFMSQKRLAERLGVDQSLVSAWGRGLKLTRMTRGKVARIERELGTQRVEPGALASILFGPPIAELPRAVTGEAFVSELRRLIQWWDDAQGARPTAPEEDRAERTPQGGDPHTLRTGTQRRKRRA